MRACPLLNDRLFSVNHKSHKPLLYSKCFLQNRMPMRAVHRTLLNNRMLYQEIVPLVVGAAVE